MRAAISPGPMNCDAARQYCANTCTARDDAQGAALATKPLRGNGRPEYVLTRYRPSVDCRAR
jgi:hypothetical protein